ncbi:MAG: cell division protein FtsA [Planctomycetota bacterium]|jgi:cell division protein FtsA
MAKNASYVVGLDIGTTKICCVVAEVAEDGSLGVVGLGEAPSRGLRKGVVVNLDATVDAIKSAVGTAELMAGVDVEQATVGIAGGHIRSFNSRGVVAVSGKDHAVSQDDLNRVMAAAQAVSIPQDREILHVTPQEFVLDDQGGIAAPRGMIGSKLEANVHIVTSSTTSVQNLVTCVNRAGIEVRDTVVEQLAVAEAVLTQDEKELGVALLDIGGGTTDLAIFEKGSIWHTAVLAVGGDHFTNDLAVGLRTPIPDAERLKLKYGCALASLVEESTAIEVPSVGGRKPRLLSLQVMAEILQPRAAEIFTLIREEVTRAGFDRSLNAGVVLAGGGSLLPGVLEVAEQIFDMPVRLGLANGAQGLAEPASAPQYATAVGLAIYGARNRPPRRRMSLSVPVSGIGWMGGRVKAWFSEIF